METLLPFEKIKLNVLVKKLAETSPKYGIDPTKRKVELLLQYGIVNLNKPRGPTSHEISAFVQKILGIKKSGHSGTLDPRVTGVLPVAVGRATRVVQHLLTSGKEYVAIMHLHKEVDRGTIEKTLQKFTGEIDQLPPIKSAVKRQIRKRKIYYIEIIEIKDKDVLMRIGCQAGTYIRKLLHDIGKDLKVGAHMAELIRTKAAGFTDEELWSLQDLRDAFHFYTKEGNEKYIRKVMLPIERGVDHLKKIWVIDSSVNCNCHRR